MPRSNQYQDIAALIGHAQPPRGERFDPFEVTDLAGEAVGDEYVLRNTRSYAAIQNYGNATVALFSRNGEGIKPHTRDSEDVIRHACDVGILVGHGSYELLLPSPEEPTRLVPTGQRIEALPLL